MAALPLLISFIFFLIGCSYTIFGSYVVLTNSKVKSYRLFFVLCTFLSVWAFGFALAVSAPDQQTCLFWRRVSALGWATFPGILLHYFLVLTDRKKLLKQWWIYFLIYIPAAVMVYVFALSRNLAIIQYNFVNTSFGWINISGNNIWDQLYNAYYLGSVLMGLMLLANWTKNTRNPQHIKQGRFIWLCLCISLGIGVLFELFRWLFFPDLILHLLPNSIYIAALGIFYAIKKYGLIKMKPTSIDEMILNTVTRRRIYDYLTVAFIAGSLLNIISQYVLEKRGDLTAILQLSSLLLLIGLVIQIAQRMEPLKKHQNKIILVLLVVAIPVISLRFISTASLTIWAFPFILILSVLVFNNRIAIVGITVSIFLTQILVFIIMPQVIVRIDNSDHVVRIGLFGIGLWVAFFVNELYVQRLKENTEQIKIQKMIAQISADFLNVNSGNFDVITNKWLAKSGDIFDVDRSCLGFFSSDKTRLSCTNEWHRAGLESPKESHQDILVADAPDWINEILTNKVAYHFENEENISGEKSSGDQGKKCCSNVTISIPLSCRGDVRGFLAFSLYREEKAINDKHKDLLEIIANLLADAMLKLESEKEINYLAYYDQLTGRPNRLLFGESVNEQIEIAKRTEKMIGIIYLDIDSFRTVNDIMGHEGSSELLVQVSQKLVRSIKNTDTVCRFEGDGFLIMLNNISREKEVIKVANRITGLFKHAFMVNGQEFYISANAGIALYPKDGENAEELIKNADIALYKAKDKGKNNYILCSLLMKEEVNFKNKLTSNLYHALENRELQVYYQPQVCLKTGKIIAVEALLRWQHPELGIILPKVIIPLAEQTGLINPIGEWVLKTACSQNKAWQDSGLPPVRIAVNISASQFGNPMLIGMLKKLLKETELKPKYLELELTENIAIDKSSYIIRILSGLKKLGLYLSIDDFGTEYSSLSRLKLLPVDQLKIDKQFIDGIVGNEKDQAIVNTIIQLAKNLGIDVIAEGAETEEQVNFLKENRCDTVQGFYYYHPMPAAEMVAVLRQNGATP